MRELDTILNNYYENNYIEDERLKKDKTHYLEYITTTTYINKYLNKNDHILEIGAGTGAYSLYYASLGYKVDAVELIQNNVDLLKSKITNNMDINAYQGNALDLSRYEDNTFDITLLLGPLYHLFKKEERDKALSEAIRVTKYGGKILVAYIMFDSCMIDWGFRRGNIYSNYGSNKQVSLNFKPNNEEKLIFYMSILDEIKDELKNYNVLKFVSTDGIGKVLSDSINNMTDEEYDLFVKYHLSTCEREDLIGYSGHIISIIEK